MRIPISVALLALLACGPAAEAPPADGPRVVHQHEDARFALTVAASSGDTGERIEAEVVARGDYHLSLDYPTKFELAGQPVQRKEAADALSEERLAFVAELPAGPSGRRVTGRLRFGVCLRDELCEPVDHGFEAELN